MYSVSNIQKMMVVEFLNFFTIVGAVFSGMISVQMFRMDGLTFINKILFTYFTVDTVHGFLIGYFSTKLLESTESNLSDTCSKFISIWMSGISMKSLFITGVMMCRSNI